MCMQEEVLSIRNSRRLVGGWGIRGRLCTVDLAGGRLGWQATTTTPQSPSAPPPPTDAEDAAVGSEYLSLGIVHLVSLIICYLYVGLFELTYVPLTSEICGPSNLRRVGLDENNRTLEFYNGVSNIQKSLLLWSTIVISDPRMTLSGRQ